MQNFNLYSLTDNGSAAFTKILDALPTILSQSSGTAFPTNNLQTGMPCYRTDLKSLYILRDAATQDWVKVLDLVNAFGNADMLDGKHSNELAAAIHTHTKSNITDFPSLASVATSGKYSDLSGVPAESPAKGGNSATVGGASPGNGAGNVLVIGSDGKVPSSNMPIATATVLGAVKQGANITIAPDGTISGSPPQNVAATAITVTGSTRSTLTPTAGLSISGVNGSVTISTLGQTAGVTAGTYTVLSLLQEIVNISHKHTLVTATGNQSNCNCSSGGDDDGSNY